MEDQVKMIDKYSEKEFDFDKAVKNPYAKELKRQIPEDHKKEYLELKK